MKSMGGDAGVPRSSAQAPLTRRRDAPLAALALSRRRPCRRAASSARAARQCCSWRPVLLLAVAAGGVELNDVRGVAFGHRVGGQVCFDGLLASVNHGVLLDPTRATTKSRDRRKSDGDRHDRRTGADQAAARRDPARGEQGGLAHHFVLMSRNLEVQQGGPFAFAAAAASKELWEAMKSVDNRAGRR